MDSKRITNETSTKDEFCIWKTVKQIENELEISEEYVLPDYLPEIKRVLSVKAFVRDNEVYPDGNIIKISGEVCFNLIYLGEEGLVRCVFFSKNYSNDIPGDDSLDSSILRDETTVKSAQCRPVSQRKLNFRAKVITKCDFLDKYCVSPKVVGSDNIEDEFTVERNTENKETVNYISKEISDIRISEDIEIDSQDPEIKEILSCDIELFATECKASKGKISLKGNARVTCLCSADDESNEKYIVSERNIPIYHTEETKILDENWDLYAVLKLGELQTGFGKNSYGENKVIELDFVCKASVMCMKNEPTYFTKDAFSTVFGYNNTYKTLENEKLIRVHNANFSVEGKSELPQNENITGVLCSKSKVDFKSAEIVSGKISLSGDCEVSAILESTSDEQYIPQTYQFPVKIELPSENAEHFKYYCHSGILDSKCRIDGKNIVTDLEIGIALCVFSVDNTNVIESINIDKTKEIYDNVPTLLLYYPDKNETNWDIAKKYGVRKNEIDSQQRENGVIIIPKKKQKQIFNKIISD